MMTWTATQASPTTAGQSRGQAAVTGGPFLGSGPYQLLPGVFGIVPSGSSAAARARARGQPGPSLTSVNWQDEQPR